MSNLSIKRLQIGNSTAGNNFVIRQPDTADATLRISNGNIGTTTDLVTINASGAMTLNGKLQINHGDGSFYKNLGTIYSGTAGAYLHVKLSCHYTHHAMTMFRITGFFPYGAYTETYMGCYLYGASPTTPYGQIISNQGNQAAGAAMYYSNDATKYLCLSFNWNTTYNGLMIEHIGAGSSYGSNMPSDLQILSFTKTASSTGAY